MHFAVGELVVYPAHGVGVIEALEEKSLSGQVYNFYVLRIFENDMKIMIPAQNVDEVGLRRLIKKTQVKQVYDRLKEPPHIAESGNWNRRHRDYMEKIKTGSLFEVAEVLSELLTMRGEKELSFGERKLLDTAKMLLIKEVALATGKTEQVVDLEINGFFKPPKSGF